MVDKARYATAHWLRFKDVTLPEHLQLTGQPQGAASWKIGPSGPVGPDGYRLPSEIWCALGLYRDLAQARTALAARCSYMPFLSSAVESWHLLLVPFRHTGECNHLDRQQPGELFDVAPDTAGGPVVVITTAGFVFGPDLKMERVIEFRRNVDLVNDWLGKADGCLANRPFTPHTRGDDGCTFSVWRNDEAMLNASYRSGLHRTHLDRHKAVNAFDRSSFTRFRLLDACGQWNGVDPLAQA